MVFLILYYNRNYVWKKYILVTDKNEGMFDDKKQLIAYGLKDGSTVHYGFRPIIKRVKKPIIKKYKKPRKPKF